ncbi:MAG TPA: type II secretion system F family protein [Vicinamibacterales bacterium]|nr:type II secretion system F family protein [Vicinamibacterales bacterium]
MAAIAVGVFATVFLGIWGAYYFFILRHEQQAVGVVKRRLKPFREAKVAQTNLIAQRKAMSAIAPLDAYLSRGQSSVTKLETLVEQSGANVTVGTLLLGSAVLGLLTFVVVYRLTGWALLGIPAGLLVCILPTVVLRYMRTYRMRKFEDQFPEALDLMSRSLRAGHAFTTGIEMVGAEMPKPIGPEFRLLYDRQNYGMPIPDALKSFAERIPVLDARFFATAVLIQRESGGNLSEVLDNLSSVIRDRQRVKRQMRVLSAHGRITGWVLVCLPPCLAVALMATSPEHRAAMFGQTLGIQMMIAAAVLQLIGTVLINRIVNVEY